MHGACAPCNASPGAYCPVGSVTSGGTTCPVGFWCQGGAVFPSGNTTLVSRGVGYGSYATFTCVGASGVAAAFTGVAFASMGQPSGTCPDFAVNAACHASNSVAVATSLCVGNSNCTFWAAPYWFGDPCPNQVCSPPPSLPPSLPPCLFPPPAALRSKGITNFGSIAYPRPAYPTTPLLDPHRARRWPSHSAAHARAQRWWRAHTVPTVPAVPPRRRPAHRATTALRPRPSCLARARLVGTVPSPPSTRPAWCVPPATTAPAAPRSRCHATRLCVARAPA